LKLYEIALVDCYDYLFVISSTYLTRRLNELNPHAHYVCWTDLTCVSKKINGGMWLKLYKITISSG